MKLLGLIVLVLVAASVKGNKDMIIPIMEKCKATTGATDEDVAKLMMHAPAENQAQKCMFSCLMTTMGVVRKFL